MAFPVQDVSRPVDLTGQTNGKLSQSILTETAGLAGGPGVLLVTPAARAWRALTAAAFEAGHTLKISHPNSAYRPYADQERIFLARYVTHDTGTRDRKFWRGQWWWLRPGMASAAIPGTSNHGWALAIDVGEERDGDTGAESIDAGTVAWLVANEERFGFSHEIQSEPWHIRYFTGDRTPQAVLDHERGTQPAPPDDEEDDMARIVWFKAADGSPHAYRVAGIHGKHLTNESLQRSRAEGDEEPQGSALGAQKVPLSTDEQGRYILADGPCRNVG